VENTTGIGLETGSGSESELVEIVSGNEREVENVAMIDPYDETRIKLGTTSAVEAFSREGGRFATSKEEEV
jgi:predicted secreted protein